MRQQITIVKCDICQSEDNVTEKELPGGRTIDLCELDANTLEDVLQPYMDKSTKAPGNVRAIGSARSVQARGASGAGSKAADKAYREQVRAAVTAKGYKLNERGRIPEVVYDMYKSGDWSGLSALQLARIEEPKGEEPKAATVPAQKKAPAKKAPAKKAPARAKAAA